MRRWVMGLLMLELVGAGACASNHAPPRRASTRAAIAVEPSRDEKGLLESAGSFLFHLPGGIIDQFTGKTPGRFARQMEDPQFPDQRRKAINWLVARDFGRRPPYTTRYRQIAVNDPDFTVRAAALRALNRARDRDATGTFIQALTDKNDLVRWEAAKALANVPDPTAVEPLEKIVSNAGDNKDVRIAAADALRHFRDAGVTRTLVSVLNGRDFGVAWQARRSLKQITGKDLHYDEQGWVR